MARRNHTLAPFLLRPRLDGGAKRFFQRARNPIGRDPQHGPPVGIGPRAPVGRHTLRMVRAKKGTGRHGVAMQQFSVTVTLPSTSSMARAATPRNAMEG